MTYDELKALIEKRGVHQVFGVAGEGWYIEQNADELAHFLVAMQALGVQSILKIGSDWTAGLERFLAYDMGWRVVSIDTRAYGHNLDGIHFLIPGPGSAPLPEDTYDLVIIDGNADYKGTAVNLHILREVRRRVTAFHDIAGLRDCEGRQQYWREIAYDGDALKPGYYELIAEGEQRAGLGWYVKAELEAEKPAEKPAPKKRKPRKKKAKE